MHSGHKTGTAWTAHLEDYATLRSISRAGWAWEFLRQNPDYKRDVERNHAHLPTEIIAKAGLRVLRPPDHCQRANRWGLEFFRALYIDGATGLPVLDEGGKPLYCCGSNHTNRGS